MPSFNQWQTRDYPGGDAPFRQAETMGPTPRAHDRLDAIRMNWRRTPESDYPDGYLGTMNTRRGDRLYDGLKARGQVRPNSRGIHKGERIDARDYFWPAEFNHMTALECQARGVRFAPPGIGMYLEDERYPTDRAGVGPRGVAVGARNANTGVPAAPTSPDRISALRAQAPTWSTGRGNPGMTVAYPGR